VDPFLLHPKSHFLSLFRVRVIVNKIQYLDLEILLTYMVRLGEVNADWLWLVRSSGFSVSGI
jgi:hypothetical protein